MFSVRGLCAPSTPFCSSSSSSCCHRSKYTPFSSSRPPLSAAALPGATLRVDPSEHLKSVSGNSAYDSVAQEAVPPNSATLVEPERLREGGEEQRVPGIHVPKQKYIPVSKADLLDAVLSTFESKEEADEFSRFARCLDSVLHAEHKIMLEEMRSCYPHVNSEEGNHNRRRSTEPGVNGSVLEGDNYKLDFRNIFLESLGSATAVSEDLSRIAVATRFQKTFMKLLQQAQFEEISIHDLLLTRSLNTDYLLTLPIYVDWKKALQSNAIIFRRGYTSEVQKGRLIVDKLDYLQSRFLQKIFSLLSIPLKQAGNQINEALKNSSQRKEIQSWLDRTKDQLMEHSLAQKVLAYMEKRYKHTMNDDEKEINDLPIWIAAQRAVPRYEGFLSSIGPRGRLVRKLLTWMGFIPPLPDLSQEDSMNNHSESFARSIFLSRITLSDIWKPASKEFCGNNPWKMFKSGISILFSKSILQEPAFQELILLYSGDTSQAESKLEFEALPLHLKIYERIPIPDLPVIFPHKKLSFRILDTIRLDIASIIGLLAFIVNYKFETITSSPSAFWLDIIATTALILFVSRVALGYKQTWDRYQLLVNKTLYEKTLASGFGSVHFLLDASEQQQCKEAVLAYALLLENEKNQIFSIESVKDACEDFVYCKFGVKIEMPIDDAMETLLRFGIVNDNYMQEDSRLRVLPCSKACEELQIRWNMLLG